MTTYATDFSEYGTGSNPVDWTSHAIGTGTFNVVDIGGGVHAMRVIPQSGVRWSIITWDDIDADANRGAIEITAKVRFPTGLTRYQLGGGVIGRSGTAPNFQGYIAAQGWDGFVTNYHALLSAGTSSGSELASGLVYTPSDNIWYWIRARYNSTSLQLWTWADGGTVKTNADAVDISVTDSAFTIGAAGIWFDGGSTQTMEVGFWGAGTNGDAAPVSAGAATLLMGQICT